MSFNNYYDLNAAVSFVKGFENPAAVVIKHNNPTGLAESTELVKAYKDAHSCDPISAFGGIIGLNREVDGKTAALIQKSGFMECVVAPKFSKEALEVLTQKKNVRLIQLNLKDLPKDGYDLKYIQGGLLVQEQDTRELMDAELKTVTKKKPTQAQLASMKFGWKAIKNVKSNAIILVKGSKVVGIGCGQTSRVEAVNIAVNKAGKNAKGAVLISDAFFPMTDNIQLAAKAGIKSIIQTGGSIADKDVIAEADKQGVAMVMTGVRHFKH